MAGPLHYEKCSRDRALALDTQYRRSDLWVSTVSLQPETLYHGTLSQHGITSAWNTVPRYCESARHHFSLKHCTTVLWVSTASLQPETLYHGTVSQHGITSAWNTVPRYCQHGITSAWNTVPRYSESARHHFSLKHCTTVLSARHHFSLKHCTTVLCQHGITSAWNTVPRYCQHGITSAWNTVPRYSESARHHFSLKHCTTVLWVSTASLQPETLYHGTLSQHGITSAWNTVPRYSESARHHFSLKHCTTVAGSVSLGAGVKVMSVRTTVVQYHGTPAGTQGYHHTHGWYTRGWCWGWGSQWCLTGPQWFSITGHQLAHRAITTHTAGTPEVGVGVEGHSDVWQDHSGSVSRDTSWHTGLSPHTRLVHQRLVLGLRVTVMSDRTTVVQYHGTPAGTQGYHHTHGWYTRGWCWGWGSQWCLTGPQWFSITGHQLAHRAITTHTAGTPEVGVGGEGHSDVCSVTRATSRHTALSPHTRLVHQGLVMGVRVTLMSVQYHGLLADTQRYHHTHGWDTKATRGWCCLPVSRDALPPSHTHTAVRHRRPSCGQVSLHHGSLAPGTVLALHTAYRRRGFGDVPVSTLLAQRQNGAAPSVSSVIRDEALAAPFPTSLAQRQNGAAPPVSSVIRDEALAAPLTASLVQRQNGAEPAVSSCTCDEALVMSLSPPR